MSEVTLHGYPIQVGDTVYIMDEPVTVCCLTPDSNLGLHVETKGGEINAFDKEGRYIWNHPPDLFWQPVPKEILERCKEKLKQEEVSNESDSGSIER